MKLTEWMSREGISQERLAELLSEKMQKRVRQPLVSTWCRGKTRPETNYVWAIHQVTGGAVTLADWFSPAPAEPTTTTQPPQAAVR